MRFEPFAAPTIKIMNSKYHGLIALSPIVVFLAVYLVSSLAVGDFYKIPVSSAFLVASVYAMLVTGGRTIEEKLSVFSSGAGDPNLLLMIWIFVLAGAFASTAKAMGAIDATVNLALAVIPGKMLFAGFFLTACFISFSIGTSVGTIVALVPIATGIAAETGIGLPHLTAVIVGGAFFGDNLSFISDTTIAATRAVGCQMRDKFRANIRIVLPAVILVTGVYVFQGLSVNVAPETVHAEWYKIVPYLAVIALALAGLNVTLTLTIGIVLCAAIGMCDGEIGWSDLLSSMGSGIAGMGDLIIVTLLAGGMLALIRQGGGLDCIISSLTRHAKGQKGAQLSIAALVSLANLCTANNTIAIITTGGIADDITRRYGLDPRRTASILDTFSCMVQGLIPYGAQLLMASGLAGISALEIIPHLYYPPLLGLSALLFILLDKKEDD